jgi:amino acid transporter
MASQSQGAQSQGLERNAIGLTEVLFQSITHMAPAVAVALSIGFATSLSAGLTPLAVLLALIAVLFTAYSIGELARHLPSAGGMYTYVGKGIGSYAGWLVAWAFLLAEPIVPPLLFAAFGFYGAALLDQLFGISNEFLWVPLAILCAVIVWFLTYRGISLSTRTGVVLGSIEIAIFLLVSALLVVNAGSANTVSVFIPGDEGIKPALQGMVFCLLAFVGFEAAAPLAEETRDPKRTIRRAVLWSAVLIGAFYVFCYYAATVYFGPDKMADFLKANDGNPWGGMAEEVLPGIGSLLVLFAILNSCLANANAGANASTRAIFSLGRSRLLPAAMAAIHPTHRTPVNAVHVQGILGIVIAVGLGLWLGSAYPDTPGPLNVYFVLGYALGLLFAGMYIAVNLAVIAYYYRFQRADFNPLKHVIVPIVGVILMIPAFISASPGGITIPIIDLDITSLAPPYSFAPPLVAIWMIAGIVLGLILRATRPAALGTVGVAMGETEADMAPAPST